MHHLGFFPCPDDLDLWMTTMMSPEYGFEYYAYVLIREFVDIHNIVTNLMRAKNYLGYFVDLGF